MCVCVLCAYFMHVYVCVHMSIYLYICEYVCFVCSVRLNLADDVCEVLHTILEPISFKADMRMAMKPIFSDTKIDVSGHLEKVKVRQEVKFCNNKKINYIVAAFLRIAICSGYNCLIILVIVLVIAVLRRVQRALILQVMYCSFPP